MLRNRGAHSRESSVDFTPTQSVAFHLAYQVAEINVSATVQFSSVWKLVTDGRHINFDLAHMPLCSLLSPHNNTISSYGGKLGQV